MYQITLINKLLLEYKKWTIKLKNSSIAIENNILQKDSSDELEEKIMSIGISSILVWIATSIAGLFGVVASGGIVVIIFIIGWILSKLINKKVFGVERIYEDISDEEKSLLNSLKMIQNEHNKIRTKINTNSMIVNFKDYGNLKVEFDNVLNMLNLFDTSHLAFKYRLKHHVVSKRYGQSVDQFKKIYANKKER
jgi:hypothetical protein